MAARAVARKRPIESAKKAIAQEISAGGVIYRFRDGIAEVALIRVRERWCLPKGKLETDEAVADAAVREVREETGLSGKIVTKLGDITYWYTVHKKDTKPTRVFKRVTFFLLKYQGGDVEFHDTEVDKAAWFAITEARNRLAFSSEKKVMDHACILLEKKAPV
jgi:8-oxo-dGTP diphosphatase